MKTNAALRKDTDNSHSYYAAYLSVTVKVPLPALGIITPDAGMGGGPLGTFPVSARFYRLPISTDGMVKKTCAAKVTVEVP